MLSPLPYLPFVALMDRATLILTDSGGVQEEAPSLGKPVLVMRETTERPEAVEAGTVQLVGASEPLIVEHASRLLLDKVEHASRLLRDKVEHASRLLRDKVEHASRLLLDGAPPPSPPRARGGRVGELADQRDDISPPRARGGGVGETPPCSRGGGVGETPPCSRGGRVGELADQRDDISPPRARGGRVGETPPCSRGGGVGEGRSVGHSCPEPSAGALAPNPYGDGHACERIVGILSGKSRKSCQKESV